MPGIETGIRRARSLPSFPACTTTTGRKARGNRLQPERSGSARFGFAGTRHTKARSDNPSRPFLLHSRSGRRLLPAVWGGAEQGDLGLNRNKRGGTMIRLRSADDFFAIRARMDELRRERARSLVEKDPLSVIESPLYADSGGRALTGKSGIPGWRVTSRKRPSSN
jgi:hypothetical protein